MGTEFEIRTSPFLMNIPGTAGIKTHKKMKQIFSLICLFLIFNTAKAIGPYCIGDTLHCLALNGLKLRETPKGKVMASIALGEDIIVLATRDSLIHSDTYEKIGGHWIKVSYKSNIGYVFDGYLSKMPAPSLQDSSLQGYLERVAVAIGKPVEKKSDCPNTGGGEGTYSVSIQQYQGSNFTAKFIGYGGWEWGHSTITFDYVAFEEIFLICKVVFCNSYAKRDFIIRRDSHEPFVEVKNEGSFGYDNFHMTYVREPDRAVIVRIDSGY